MEDAFVETSVSDEFKKSIVNSMIKHNLGKKLHIIYNIYNVNDRLHAVHFAIKIIYGNTYYMTGTMEMFKTKLPDIIIPINDHLRHLDETTTNNELKEILDGKCKTLTFLYYLSISQSEPETKTELEN